ncbi:hypothetical protein GCK72_003666 [Caenorhabditis remanei]|uniref:BHLH domain-containing protein n=1 Tax=Caenorhabditis remanei TaxID=31234 RepID=A0A6A5HA41_CAERE|nr:hypothetical protein GCK72_003666 [Caenorhabditis remanei]KAF1763721.1 hypothetical protein GCK72_003666 [Caenorhabditis remanei]
MTSSNFLSMFPVTYTFENGVYSTIINQNPNVQNGGGGLNNLENDVQKLMVPLIEPQLHLQQPSSLIQPQLQIQHQHQLPSSSISQTNSSNSTKKYVNPFAPEATVPLPIELEDQFGPYSSSVWKRNERERCRVKNVNDGYERLRKHLPIHFDEKRISKVDTLRLAIRYIRHLDNLLKNHLHQYNCKCFNGFQEESEGNISIDISTFSFNSAHNNNMM